MKATLEMARILAWPTALLLLTLVIAVATCSPTPEERADKRNQEAEIYLERQEQRLDRVTQCVTETAMPLYCWRNRW